MLYCNDYDIARAQHRFSANPATPNLSKAADSLAALADWANDNSDGWAYWPKPARAAAKLQELLSTKLIEHREDGTVARAGKIVRFSDATPAELTAALRPVKAFLTRQGVDHAQVIA